MRYRLQNSKNKCSYPRLLNAKDYYYLRNKGTLGVNQNQHSCRQLVFYQMNCQPVSQGIQRTKPKRISLNQGNQPITIATQQ